MNLVITVKGYILFLPSHQIFLSRTFSGANDFSPLANEVLTISSTMAVGNFMCLNISVPDDMIVEDSETFTITMEIATLNDVVMGPSTAIVTIIDDDGECNHLSILILDISTLPLQQ